MRYRVSAEQPEDGDDSPHDRAGLQEHRTVDVGAEWVGFYVRDDLCARGRPKSRATYSFTGGSCTSAGVPHWTIRPSRSTAMRSATASASSPSRRIDHRPVLGPQTEAMQIAHKRAPGSGVRERWVVDEVVNKEQVRQIVVIGRRPLPWRRRVHDAIAVHMRGAITTGRLPGGTVKRHVRERVAQDRHAAPFFRPPLRRKDIPRIAKAPSTHEARLHVARLAAVGAPDRHVVAVRGNDPEQCGLARAGQSDHGRDLSRPDKERYPGEGWP